MTLHSLTGKYYLRFQSSAAPAYEYKSLLLSIVHISILTCNLPTGLPNRLDSKFDGVRQMIIDQLVILTAAGIGYLIPPI